MNNFLELEKYFESIDVKLNAIKIDLENSFNKCKSQINLPSLSIDDHETNLHKGRDELLLIVKERQEIDYLKLNSSNLLVFNENIDNANVMIKVSYTNDFDLVQKLKYHNFINRMMRTIEFSREFSAIEHLKVYVLNKSRFCILDYSKNELLVMNESLEVVKTVKFSGKNNIK